MVWKSNEISVPHACNHTHRKKHLKFIEVDRRNKDKSIDEKFIAHCASFKEMADRLNTSIGNGNLEKDRYKKYILWQLENIKGCASILEKMANDLFDNKEIKTE